MSPTSDDNGVFECIVLYVSFEGWPAAINLI
jgi:hypothetical protein